MPRSKDLDTIAPDDLIVVDSVPEPKKPTPVKKTVVVKKTVPVIEEPVVASDNILAQKIYDIFGHTKSPFSAALVFPKVFSFAEQNDGEVVLLALRSHWFTNTSWILMAIFMFTVPSLVPLIPIPGLDGGLRILLSFTWYLITFAYSFEKFISWYFDVSIVTNRRVVDIDFNNLLDKKFSEAELSKIQDISSRVSGVSQTFLNYGTVLIQTAAEQNVIVFEKVPFPGKITKLLQDLRFSESEKDKDGGQE
jgi:rRNA processing protein Gar1